MKDISTKGLLIGSLAWFIMIFAFSDTPSCLKTNICQSGDFVVFALCAIAFLAPAWLVAVFFSN